jgi:hypothetical protein
MPGVCHLGFAVSVEHPAVWIDKGERIVRDLIEIFAHPEITPRCLRHLLANRWRLIRGNYEHHSGHGCLLNVLTEPLGNRQVRNRNDLIRLFGRQRGIFGWFGYVAAKDSPEYQPAKWLVRLVDRQFCGQIRARYGRSCELFDYDLVISVAEQVLAQREMVDFSIPLAASTAR